MISTDYITNGNLEAKECLEAWGQCLRAVDDIIDKETYDADSILNAIARDVQFLGTPFYRKHVHQLQMPVLIATGLWEVSCNWERRDELWKRQWADVLRHSDFCLIGAISLICSGWERTSEFYPAFLSAGYVDHLDRYGAPK